MKSEFFVEYGCYVGMEAIKIVVTHNESVTEENIVDRLMSEYRIAALEVCEAYYGLHGFEADGWDDDSDSDEYDYDSDAASEYMEEQAQVSVVPWVEEEHFGAVSHGNGVDEEEYYYD